MDTDTYLYLLSLALALSGANTSSRPLTGTGARHVTSLPSDRGTTHHVVDTYQGTLPSLRLSCHDKEVRPRGGKLELSLFPGVVCFSSLSQPDPSLRRAFRQEHWWLSQIPTGYLGQVRKCCSIRLPPHQRIRIHQEQSVHVLFPHDSSIRVHLFFGPNFEILLTEKC